LIQKKTGLTFLCPAAFRLLEDDLPDATPGWFDRSLILDQKHTFPPDPSGRTWFKSVRI